MQLYSIESEGKNCGSKWLRNHVVQLCSCDLMSLCSCTVLNQKGRIVDPNGLDTMLCGCAVVQLRPNVTVQLYSCTVLNQKGKIVDQNGLDTMLSSCAVAT